MVQSVLNNVEINLPDHERQTFSRYIPRVLGQIQQLGYSVQISFDFHLHKQIHTTHKISWPALSPVFDIHYNPHLGQSNALFIMVINNGVIIGCCAIANIYVENSLKESLETLSFSHAVNRPDDIVECIAPTAMLVRGYVAYPGSLWIHPDHIKDHKLSALLSRAIRALGYARFVPDWIFTYIYPKRFNTMMHQYRDHGDFSYPTIEFGVIRQSKLYPGETHELLIGLCSRHIYRDRVVVAAQEFMREKFN